VFLFEDGSIGQHSMKTIMSIVLAMCLFSVKAQTNEYKFVVVTNWYRGAANLRVVGDELYNIRNNPSWVNFQGDFVGMAGSNAVISTFTMKPVYQATTTSRATYNYMGGISGYRDVPTTVQVGTEKQAGQTIIVKNFNITDNSSGFYFEAINVGTTEYHGQTMELWDMGKPYIYQVVITNKVKISN
jgi:hypothetical protein